MANKETGCRLSAVARAHALAVERTAAAMAMFDRDMRYIAASKAWYGRYCIADASIVGRSHYELFPEISERWRELHRRGLAGVPSNSDLDLFARADDSVHALPWSIEPWRESTGAVGGIFIVSKDLSEVQQLESKLGLLSLELEALFEQRVVAFLVTDSSGEVLRANRLYLEMTGLDPAEVLGNMFHARVHGQDRDGLLASFHRLRDGACESFEGRHRQRRADGSIVWLKHSMSMLPVPANGAARSVLFLSDATPRMELERRLREMDRIASVGLLGLTLGHDMINALLPIRANLNAIRLLIPEHLRGPTVSRSLDAVEQGVSYLQHLADGAGGLAGDLCEAPPESSDGGSSLDLRAWWDAVEPVVRTALPDEIRLECAFAEGVPRVKIPRHDLTRSVLNLVVNSRQSIEVRQGVGL